MDSAQTDKLVEEALSIATLGTPGEIAVQIATNAVRVTLAHHEAEIAAAVERALMAVVDAVRDYLPPDGIDAQECLNRIIGATDNPEINPIIAEIENGRA